MADPFLQSLCCLDIAGKRSDLRKEYDLLVLHQAPYYGVSLGSAIVGLFGSIYQIWLRNSAPFPRYQYFNVGLRGNNILFWLAISDTMAALGLIARSSVWFVSQNILGESSLWHPMNALFCEIVSGWIQFAYTSSHLWTLMYAIDVRRITFDKPFVAPVYHTLTWFGSLACCTTGLTLLYLPGIGSDPYIRVLPNHVASYFPLVLTCLTCPFLFWSAFRQAGVSLSLRYARYTTTERRLIESLRLKFLLIVGVFYLCWMPNLVNGLVLWLSWYDLPVTWVLANWYLMALLNPLQTVFNIVLYKLPKRRQPNSFDYFASLRKWRRTDSTVAAVEETPLLL